MKKSITLFFAVMISVVLVAQNDGRQRVRREFNPEEMAMRLTEDLHKAVALDSMQYQFVYLLNYADMTAAQDSMKARRQRMEEMRKNGQKPERRQMTEEQRKAQMEIMQQRKAARDEQMKGILSPEQYEKYLKYDEERSKRSPRGKGVGPERGRRTGNGRNR